MKLIHFIFIANLFIISISFYFISTEVKQDYENIMKNEVSQLLHLVKYNSEKIINDNTISKNMREEKLIQYLNRLSHQDFYVWANDQDGIAKAHIKDNVRGRFQKSYMRHIDSILKQDVAFEISTNVNPISNKRQEKINGFFLLKPWNWIIGHGKYIHQKNISAEAIRIFMYTLITTLILELLLITMFLRIIKKQ